MVTYLLEIFTAGYAVSLKISARPEQQAYGPDIASRDNLVLVLEHLCIGPSPQLIHWDRNPGLDAVSRNSAGRDNCC